MTENEYTVLSQALDSLDVTVVDVHMYAHSLLQVKGGAVDLYNYRALGKMMMGKRMLAELLCRPHHYPMPGECIDDEDIVDDICRFVSPSEYGVPLTQKEKDWLIQTLMVVLDGVSGLGDGDDACLRVAKRLIAEVACYPDLGRFRLMMEKDVKPLYFPDYQPS